MMKHGTCLCLDWGEASYVISFADSGNLSFFAFAPFGKQSLECEERRILFFQGERILLVCTFQHKCSSFFATK